MSDDETTPAPAEESPEAAPVDEQIPAEKGASVGMSEAELRAQLEEHFRSQKVSDVLMQFLINLSTLAYAKMGITEDSQAYKDLEQSRLAIDSFKALLDAVGPRLDSQDASALAGALASMQMTFARASAESK